MNRCSDNISGSPSFTLSTHKLDNGKYEARCDSLPELKGHVADTEAEAIRSLRMAVETHIVSGGRF
jgi:hypothetical protein